MSVIIRDAREDDIKDILNIYGYYVENTSYSFEYSTPDEDTFRERFRKNTKDFPWLVLEDEGVICGYAYASRSFERAAYQWDASVSVYLSRQSFRKGYATALYKRLIALLYLQGYYTVYAGITDINVSSISFHEALGFVQIGIFPYSGYKHGEWVGVIWMEKVLRKRCEPPKPAISYHGLPHEEVKRVFTNDGEVQRILALIDQTTH